MHRQRLRVAACALALAFAAPARAGAPLPILDATDIAPATTGINGATLSSAPNTVIRVGAYSTLTLYIVLTRVAATAVNVTCYGGPSASVLGVMGVASAAASGVITMAPASWTYPVTGSTTLRILVGPLNDAVVQCALSGTGATSDTVTLHARLGGLP